MCFDQRDYINIKEVVHNHNEKGGKNFRKKFGCDYFTKSLAELTIHVTICKGDLTANAFFKMLYKEGAK